MGSPICTQERSPSIEKQACWLPWPLGGCISCATSLLQHWPGPWGIQKCLFISHFWFLHPECCISMVLRQLNLTLQSCVCNLGDCYTGAEGNLKLGGKGIVQILHRGFKSQSTGFTSQGIPGRSAQFTGCILASLYLLRISTVSKALCLDSGEQTRVEFCVILNKLQWSPILRGVGAGD